MADEVLGGIRRKAYNVTGSDLRINNKGVEFFAAVSSEFQPIGFVHYGARIGRDDSLSDLTVINMFVEPGFKAPYLMNSLYRHVDRHRESLGLEFMSDIIHSDNLERCLAAESFGFMKLNEIDDGKRKKSEYIYIA